MRSLRALFATLVALALAGLPAPAVAQAVGSEFQVNTYTTSAQQTGLRTGHPVAADASGKFVIVWRGAGPGDRDGIFGRRYDSAGNTLGGEFRVNSYTTGSQNYPSVASDSSGNFIVVWQRHQAGNYGDIVGQRYDSAGNTLGGEFLVNSYTTGSQYSPSVATDASGDFVVVWIGPVLDVFGQRFDREGVPQGPEFRVNSYTLYNQQAPSVASDASGNFIVVWHGVGQDESGGVFGQRYDSAGVEQGDQFRVNTYTTNGQRNPSVASDADGNFVVVWQSFAQDGSRDGVFGQRYDSAGLARGEEFQVNKFTGNSQESASIAVTGTDTFVVAWTSIHQDGDHDGVFGRRFRRPR